MFSASFSTFAMPFSALFFAVAKRFINAVDYLLAFTDFGENRLDANRRCPIPNSLVT
jgi:hypothetical protein